VLEYSEYYKLIYLKKIFFKGTFVLYLIAIYWFLFNKYPTVEFSKLEINEVGKTFFKIILIQNPKDLCNFFIVFHCIFTLEPKHKGK